MKDQLFQNAVVSAGSFEFDQSVTDVFADMIQRSVPGYQSVIELTGLLGQQFITENSNCYDLGCSLGASLISMIKGASKPAHYYGIDNSLPMIESCNESMRKLLTESQLDSTRILHQAIEQTTIENASLVALNFTLQFIEKQNRESVISNIYQGLNNGGALILSEKIINDDNDNLITPLYEQYKIAKGYSELEVAKKREALVDILVPESIESHRQRLLNSGFKQVFVWFQCFNFSSMLAIK